MPFFAEEEPTYTNVIQWGTDADDDRDYVNEHPPYAATRMPELGLQFNDERRTEQPIALRGVTAGEGGDGIVMPQGRAKVTEQLQ
jgi:hypothetical protein